MVCSPRPPPLWNRISLLRFCPVEQDIPLLLRYPLPPPPRFCALLPAASPPPTVRASSGSPLGLEASGPCICGEVCGGYHWGGGGRERTAHNHIYIYIYIYVCVCVCVCTYVRAYACCACAYTLSHKPDTVSCFAVVDTRQASRLRSAGKFDHNRFICLFVNEQDLSIYIIYIYICILYIHMYV